MKKLAFLLTLFLSFTAYSQVITGEELMVKVISAQDNVAGAHESVVSRTNESLAKDLWGKTIRLNEAIISKFFNHPGGEKVSGGIDVYMKQGKNWGYPYDAKALAEVLSENGVRITQSYNKNWINAKQDLFLGEANLDGKKVILTLYCPHQKFLEDLRIGRPQSIEFQLTGYWGSSSKDDKIYGILTKVNVEKPVIKCENDHEYDKAVSYKFCPKCGKPIER